jgi:hypothetical protein
VTRVRTRSIGVAVAVVLSATLLAVFVVYSYANAFRNWPWTLSSVVTKDDRSGIAVGARKTEVLAAVRSGLQNGRLSSLEPLRSGAAIPQTDSWFVGISACNCWLELHFSDDRLARIRHRRYIGPTE